MIKKSVVRESKRLPYSAPVEIRWLDSEGHVHSVQGTAEDLSINGLGVSVPFLVPSDKELSVTLNGVEVCGGAALRHSQRFESGWRVGLCFRLALLFQGIPGVDELLEKSGSAVSRRSRSILAAFTLRFTVRLWRLVGHRAATLPTCKVWSEASAVDRSQDIDEVIVSSLP